MSLVSIATRELTARLLIDQTWAGARVLKSPVDPIADMLATAVESVGAVLAVYTGASGRTPKDKSMGGVVTTKLIVYVYLPPRVTVNNGAMELTIDHTGAALAMDVIARQIDRALRFGPAVWQKLWGRLVLAIEDIDTKPMLVELEKGVQIPGTEITFDLKTIEEPEFGAAPNVFWADLITALGTEGEDGVLADLIGTLITDPSGLAPEVLLQLNYGLTDAAYVATGLAPVAPLVDGSAPLLDPEGLTLDGTIELTPPVQPI